MRKDDNTTPEKLTWIDLVERTAKPFEEFYILRGRILHENVSSEEMSAEDTEEARSLAHNAIRLMAFLAREFIWQSDKEAKKWFSSPTFPASSQQSTTTP